MSYTIRRQGDSDSYNVVELCCDKASDIETLPKTYAPGSVCIVIENSDVYMLNTKKEWKKI